MFEDGNVRSHRTVPRSTFGGGGRGEVWGSTGEIRFSCVVHMFAACQQSMTSFGDVPLDERCFSRWESLERQKAILTSFLLWLRPAELATADA